eukprot:GHVS01062183.1.p4 GENE.GHVS01062183.1~~GHVS01062183.1.p4  ORF type:complete len:101 (+),score=19.00 GHVS01062183.1:568-870(+)
MNGFRITLLAIVAIATAGIAECMYQEQTTGNASSEVPTKKVQHEQAGVTSVSNKLCDESSTDVSSADGGAAKGDMVEENTKGTDGSPAESPPTERSDQIG